jgi:hypothetical protein
MVNMGLFGSALAPPKNGFSSSSSEKVASLEELKLF